MKKMTAWLLALCLTALCILPVRAAEAGSAAEGWKSQRETEGNLNQDGQGSDMQTGGQQGTEPGKSAGGSNASSSPEASAADTKTDGNGEDVQLEQRAVQEDQNLEGTEGSGSDDTEEEEQQNPQEGLLSDEAAEGASGGAEAAVSAVSAGAVPFSDEDPCGWMKDYASDSPAGEIEVILRNEIPVEKVTLHVSLEQGQGEVSGIAPQDVELARNAEAHTLLFERLAPGTYTLKVTAPGFVPYVQDIQVDGTTVTAEVHTGFVNLPGVAYREGEPHPGVVMIGDVDGNGVIDGDDRRAIVDAMSRGENGVLKGDPDQNPTDLNRDGQTDLVDLQYYTSNRAKVNAHADTEAALAESIAPDAVAVNLNEGTRAEGDLEALLRGDEGTVKLTSTEGKISPEDPAVVGFNLQSSDQDQASRVEQIAISMGAGAIEEGVLFLETRQGDQESLKEVHISGGRLVEGAGITAGKGRAQDNLLTVYLGNQTAVKRVTLMITRAKGGGSLAEISRVEFLNDMENRIPEPDMYRPENLQVTTGDKSFHLTWDDQVNVTGYEVEVGYGGRTELVRAASSNLEVQSFEGGRLKNGEIYTARVRAVNGNWAGEYSGEVKAMPKATRRPDPPDNLHAAGGFRCVRMSWKSMKETDTYNVYYKEAGESGFKKITGLEQNQYEITDLKDETRYEVYVTGVNELGESGPSIHSEARTITLKPAKMPEYRLINKSNGKGKISAHIVSAAHSRGEMFSSALDADQKSALGTVDKDFASGYRVLDWDDGAYYVSPDKGLLFTLDDYYKMSYIAFAETEDIGSYGKVSVYYYDREHPEGVYAENPSVLQRTDENGRRYYLIKLSEPITADKVRLGFSRGYNLRNIVIAEVNFYHYDSLEDEILALYGDDLHTSLKEGVTRETIDALQKRLDTADPESGEYHPEREMLRRELDNARGLLESGFQDVIQIHSGITAQKDAHLGFGGLNAWQPLGITAYEGEQIVIYVGHNRLKTGADSALKLIATQYHAEAGAFASEVASLKVGRNEITMPSIQSLACEGGGALYIQYTGKDDGDRYAVRVSGGAREPVLDLYGVTDSQRRRELISAYVEELEEHVASQKSLHEQIHEAAGENNKVNRAYDQKNCILGATDIVLDQMMLSVSGEQILSGLGKGSSDQKAQRLDQSLRAMEGMMELFYQHKGLSNGEDAPASDRLPAQHLNIRYMRMFAGAFMYASGNHIGIEWGSVPGLAGGEPVVADARGKYQSGRYFGWGIAHEIGHNINQGSYAYAEVTNNYFSLLAGARDSNDSVRFRYEDVYKKVTSGTVGRAANVFTQLAMYWQLHLAYDRDYNYKTYSEYQEQLDGLFYARVDSYSRDPGRAPGNFRLGSDRDQNIMRLACAAAERDLTEFFERWGLVPDEETLGYAARFDREERALYYLTDDARVYEMENGVSGSIKGNSVISRSSTARVSEKVPGDVEISIQVSGVNPEMILGYEIIRIIYEDGKPVSQVAGFTTGNTYTDHVSVVNNRALTYEAVAVDQFGYRSAAARIGDVRIAHDGSQDKSMWTVFTNMVSEDDRKDEGTEQDPCDPETTLAISRVIDEDYGNTYEGSAPGEDAAILLSLNRVLAVCGLKYTVRSGSPIEEYEIQVSVDGENWTTVRSGSFGGQKGSQTVYFENENKDPWVCTYDAAYVRLKAPGQSTVSISEIDLLGPSGDDISFGVKKGSTEGAVGILSQDYVYEQGDGQEKKIPRGSLIFTGSYKGNPAYNVVVLYDEEGSIVGGTDEDGILKADQIILAKVPEKGELGEVSDGIWIYWIEPTDGELPDIGGRVRAGLYRVDNAMTNEGERLVSDTLPLQIPERLQEITLKKDAAVQN